MPFGSDPLITMLENINTDPYIILKSIPAPYKGPFKPSWSSLRKYRAPKWFMDSRFGVFIHWGVYSVPAFGNEWYPRHMYIPDRPEYRYHLENFGPLTMFGYKDFIQMFTAENWDPDEWARLFRKSGARFVILVAEHHDGFSLWDSSYTRWCAPRIGPKRDIVGELREAVERQGLVFGISYHRAEHWWFFEPGMRIESDVRDPRYLDLYGPAQPASLDPRASPSRDNIPPSREFLMDWLLRLVEIVEKYRPWVVYFDWWIANPSFQPYLKAFAAYYYNRCHRWGIEPVIVYKHGAFEEGTAIPDLAERGTLRDIYPSIWLADTSVDRKSWGFIKDADYKSPETLIAHMADVVSKNGVFLLNIGPRPDGTIPEESIRILLDIGEWFKLYGESIYGSSPWRIYGEGPMEMSREGFFTENELVFTGNDVRYTLRNYYPGHSCIYAIVLGRPGEEIVLRAFTEHMKLSENEILDVSILGIGKKPEWSIDMDGLRLKIPVNEIKRYPCVIRIITRKSH
ncbi:MAG: alpha-L-fucosidase [Desulfurococcaceae archaeon]